MDRRRRSPARLLAPIALVAFVFALVAVVAGSDAPEDTGGQDSGGRSADVPPSEPQAGSTTGTSTDTTSETTAEPQTETTADGEVQPVNDFYTVKTGDTLAGIAESVGVPIERLQELNPELDPQALVSGQKIKLKE
jgi:LysM repeat protein